MPIYYPDILHQESQPTRFTYTSKDVMLYALGIGLGADPLNEQELPFVYENALKVVPTAATVLASGSAESPQRVPEGLRVSTLNFPRVLHGEQKVELHQPLPPIGSFTAQTRAIAAIDKGAEKGAIVFFETTWTDDDGSRVATLIASAFARADGGFGGPSSGGPEPHMPPTRSPDVSVDFPTRHDQALIYRLSGDYNPLHADPVVAERAGFPKPILHGLCIYGITCRAVLQTFVDYDSSAIASHQVRFSSPVYPGEVITVDMWRDGKIISFEARVKDRNVTVIRNGKTVLR